MSRSTFQNSDPPIAYLLTWTTYGTWLPGDERGWKPKATPSIQPVNPLFAEIAKSKLKEPPMLLDVTHRFAVEATIRAHCAYRTWLLHAVNARSNHVHVVVAADGYAPEVVRDQFKAWCTRKLKSMGDGRERFWTEGGSCRWINEEADLEMAIMYVLEAQDRKSADEA